VRGRERYRWQIGALAAAVAGVALAAWALLVEPRRVVVERRTLRLPRWPDSLSGLRVALVSDLHAGGPHVGERRVERIAERVRRERPDLVALLGDYIDPDVPLGRAIAPEGVAEALAGIRTPLGTAAVLGNHDWENDGPRIAAALRDAGIAVLENDSVRVGDELWVVGLADPFKRKPDVSAAFGQVPPDAPVIALTHTPDLFPRIPERAALTLAGHTHGGQVGVPPIRGKLAPSRYGDRYTGGLVEEGGRLIYVSRGIGTSGLPIRFRAMPEVAILTLVAAG
jgi:predicted MPP superfamily phosphohydrolase